MDVLIYSQIIILVILIACFFYIGFRNNMVYSFCNEVLRLANKTACKRIYKNRADWEDVYDLVDKHTYERILFSFKPLKLEAWYTEEEIKILRGEE